MRRTLGLTAAASVFLLGCAASKPAEKKSEPSMDAAQIRRIAVAPFTGTGGEAITTEFVRQLVGLGITVTDQPALADAVVSGQVTEYQSNNKVLVFLGSTSLPSTGGKNVTVSNPVVSLSALASPEGAGMGLPNTQMMSINASAGITARLKMTKTNAAVWTDAFAYEGLDMASASRDTVNALVRSLRRILPPVQGAAAS